MMLVTPFLSLISTDSKPSQNEASFVGRALFLQLVSALVPALVAISVYEVLP